MPEANANSIGQGTIDAARKLGTAIHDAGTAISSWNATWKVWVGTDLATSTNTVWVNWIQPVQTPISLSDSNTVPDTPNIQTHIVRVPRSGLIRQDGFGNITYEWPENWLHSPVALPPMDEQQAAERQAAERQRREEQRREHEREVRMRADAQARARRTLEEHLTERQREELRTMRAVIIESESGRRFKLHETLVAGIHEVDEKGETMRRLCAHFSDSYIPVHDHMLGQMLALRHQEREFLQRCNVHFTRPGAPPLVQ